MSIQTTSSLKAYVYISPIGVEKFTANQICVRLDELGIEPHRLIRLPDISYMPKALSGERATLIIPGGKTMYMGNDLAPQSDNIRQKIAQGWNLFGSCAGGNLVCQQGNFQHPDSQLGILDITKDFGLWNLLPVKMHTPYYVDQQHYKQKSAPGKLVPIALPNSEKEFICYWNAGSKFDCLSKNVTVEARYADSSAIAAVSGLYGKGTVVALGIHPEIDVDSVISYFTSSESTTNSDLQNLSQKKQSYVDSSEARLAFLTSMLAKVEIL